MPPGIGSAQVTMGVVVLGSLSAIAYSHYSQVRDRNIMKEGVQRDKERVKRIRKEQKDRERQQQTATTTPQQS